jgi:membrane-associated phospholipid phosphatase
LAEIVGQDNEFISDFMTLLYATPASHPNTYRLLFVASLVGQYAAHYFKSTHPTTRNRARPSQVLPALLPPIPTPGHAAFPSGHATQAFLMALCIGFMLDGDQHPGARTMNALVLARRIARNREIAGLHYPSDSEGGFRLALAMRDALAGMGERPLFARLVRDARREWSPPEEGGDD